MDFVFHTARTLLDAGLGFGALFAVSAAMVYWRERHVRRDRAYWNGHT